MVRWIWEKQWQWEFDERKTRYKKINKKANE